MRGLLIILVTVFLWSGCENTAAEKERYSEYFDVDSLIDAQLEMLKPIDPKVLKSARLNNQSDTVSYVADTARLIQELSVFRKANINKPAFDDLYTLKTYDSAGFKIKKYVPATEEDELEVKHLTLYYKNGSLDSLHSLVVEDHWLYNSRRELFLSFDAYESENLIKIFEISGSQKMIMRDRVIFITSGSIIHKSLAKL